MKRIIVILLILAMMPLSVFAAFENTHINTGDPVKDIIAIARTQLGYMEGSLEGTVQGYNDCTKYGEWYGLNYHAWCAMFVSWCANQAGIGENIIPRHASCDEGMLWFMNRGRFYFGPCYGGTYTPQKGDIVYFGEPLSTGYDSTHVGIVYAVDDQIHVLEGNSSYKVQTVSYDIGSDYILGYGVPDYENRDKLPEPGPYITTATLLNLRSEPNTTSDVLAQIPYGTEVKVTKVENQKWGKIKYKKKTGWISLDFCASGYTVRYDSNGGGTAPELQIKFIKSDIILSKQTPERKGYTFLGWSTEPDGEVIYQPGDRYKKNKSVVLYAKWQVKAYTVKLNGNGGEPKTETLKKRYGKSLTLSVPTREGYVLNGWSTSKNGYVEYTDIYDVNKSVTLYAIWGLDRDSFTVTYDPNAGTEAPEAGSFYEGRSIAITDKQPARDGYVFEGWSYSPDSKWAELFAGDIYGENASVTLYAVWSEEQENLTAKAGKGGHILKYVTEDTVELKIIADEGNAISYIAVDSEPMGLLGDTSEYTLTFDREKHTVKVEFTYNDGLWINPYDDVSDDAIYYPAVEYCYKKDIMTGVDATHFAPNDTLTRGQFVTLLGRMHGDISTDGTVPFKDVSKKHYYYKYLVWAYNSGIVSGTSADTFSPNDCITREQLCVMLYNYEKFLGNEPKFTKVVIYDYLDGKSVSSWAKEAVAWAIYNKVVTGTKGMLEPRADATRAYTAVVIMNHTI